MNKITVYQFTDPVCVWCWGNEPVMRAIDYLYGDKIDIEFIMGGLVEDIATLFDDTASDENAAKIADERLRRNWITASARHGMPVKVTDAALFSREQPSSFPQNIAYEAAKRQNPVAAKRFLRRIREATFTEARPTARIDVLIELAAESGLNVTEFVDEYTYGNAQADFMQDRTKCRRNGITGFPSYLIQSEQTRIILGGYQNLGTFHTIIRRLSDGKIKPRKVGPSKANVADFIKRYTTVYPVEIETAFGLDRDRTDAIIDELIADKRITAEPIGDGRRLTAVPTARKERSQSTTTAKKRSTKTEAKAESKSKAKVESKAKTDEGNTKKTKKKPTPVTTEA